MARFNKKKQIHLFEDILMPYRENSKEAAKNSNQFSQSKRRRGRILAKHVFLSTPG